MIEPLKGIACHASRNYDIDDEYERTVTSTCHSATISYTAVKG